MESARRAALDGALASLRAGRMPRRAFLERALALGLTAGVAGGLLEACARRGTTYLVWESEHDAQDVYRSLVDDFNRTNNSGIHITYLNGPPTPNELHGKYLVMLGARSGSTDVLSLDVTWPAEFAANGWLLPLDRRWPARARAAYLAGPLRAATLNGAVWAAPYRVDLGVIYFRTDLLSPALAAQAPRTWSDLAAQARRLVAVGAAPSGFLWPGAATEGLVCLFAEVLASYGGSILRPGDPYTVTIQTPEARAALVEMIGWIGAASPAAVTRYTDDDVRRVWQGGEAVFMRNWLSSYPPRSDPNAAPVIGKIGIHPLPGGPDGGIGHSGIGGWQLGINAFTRNADAAWVFIQHMLAPATQLRVARAFGLPVALASAYDDVLALARQQKVD
ncbi:MAG: extracellular solute-binding protein, partial [Ktedonobacterales bacterium]|nr:extracellular solute-binding protein [Ktedonobacterales bacterium]